MKKSLQYIYVIIGMIALPAISFSQAGTLDLSFGDGGIAIFSPGTSHDVGYDLVMLEDSSMIISGVGTNAGVWSGFLMHILSDGSQDMSFGTAGITWISYGIETYAYCLERLADGKLVVAGLTYITYSNSEFFVARFLPNGLPDMSFNSTGHFIGSYSMNEEYCNTMTIQPDGKYVLAGQTYAGSGGTSLIFMRVNSNGTLDASFGTNGFTVIDAAPGNDEAINSVKIMNNGNVIGVGYEIQNAPLWGEQVIVTKLSANGQPITGFGTNGVLIPSVFTDVSKATDILIENDSLFLTGYMYNTANEHEMFIAKLDPNGNAYTSFGTGGISLLYINPVNWSYEMYRTADNKIYICGTTGIGGPGNRDFLVVRYLPSGDLDNDFNSTGYVITPIRPDWDEANAIGIAPNGKVVACGMTSGLTTTGNNDMAIVRYLNDYLPSGLYANFASVTTACEGAAVQFTDLSFSTDSTVLTWNWTFEGGSPAVSTVQNPVVTYANDGVYDVRLIVYDGIFIDTLLHENYISIEAIPSQPDMPSGPANLCEGYQGTFSTNPVIYADNYDWQVTPSGAGTITENGTSAILLASSNWTGTCMIQVRATSQCGNGPWSTAASCTINHDPVQFDLTGEGGYCEGSAGSELILSGSETGVDYELYVDNEPAGIILPGTGGPLNFGYCTQQGIYSASGYTDFCSESMVGQIYVHEMSLPQQASLPNGPGIGCDGQNSTYTTVLIEDADVYIWTLAPEEAGEMTTVFDTAHITWNSGFTGQAGLSVHGENICGAGPESEILQIDVYLSPQPEILGVSLVCSGYEEKYVTANHEGSFYTWEVNGGIIIDGAGTHQATVLWGDPGAGSVTVMEETAEGCTATTDAFDVTIEICEVVAENAGGKIMIYPNPAKDVLNVQVERSNRDLPAEIKITNSIGQVMMTKKIIADQDLIQIDVSGFPTGVYTLSMKNDNLINFRFIVIK